MNKVLIFIVLLTASARAYAQYDFPEWQTEKYKTANTAANVSYMSKDEAEILLLLNYARMDGKLFAETYLKKYVEIKNLSNSKPLKSLYTELNKLNPLPLINPSEGLTKAARSHAEYMGKSGKLGHKGKGGKNPTERIEQFVEWDVWVAENCQYGAATPVEIVLHLLIDEKVPDLGHRKNILDKRAKYIGIAIAPHKDYRINTVMEFAGGIIRNKF